MPQQRVPGAETNRRQYAGSPYGLPTHTTPQYLNAPRKAAVALPQSSAALRQYASSASPYSASNGQYTISRPQAAPQQGPSYPGIHAASVYGTTTAPKKRAYSRKRILIVSFEEHDFNSQALEKELRDVSELFTIFGFERSTRCTITDSDDSPTDQLIEELSDFVESCRDANELLVVYYSGHGGARNRGGLNLANREVDPDQTIYWNRIQRQVLFKANADVFVILDCCYAEMGVKGLHRFRRNTIAACAADETTDVPGNRSFTACLIQAANDLLASGGFFVRQLYNQIERVAAVKWFDGATRAARPFCKEHRGDKTEHEIYFERAFTPSNARASQKPARLQAVTSPSRPPTSSRRAAAPGSTQVAGEEGNSSSSEAQSEGEDDAQVETAQARTRSGAQTRGSDEAWQQHRVYARNAWSRMLAQGQTQLQAFDSLVRMSQAQMHLSSRDADAQVRRLLAS